MEICPLDDRYKEKISTLLPIFSSVSYTKYRVFIEFVYFIELLRFLKIKKIEDTSDIVAYCKSIYEKKDFSYEYKQILEYEKITNHDVKAIEYYVKGIIRDNFIEFKPHNTMVHFGLTSQDINNVAFSLMMQDATSKVMIVEIEKLLSKLKEVSSKWIKIVMITRTHGQPAVPSTLGKELRVFIDRITKQLEELKNLTLSTKFGGAVGNLNAHYCAYPEQDWLDFANSFVKSLDLDRQEYTTQIEQYDNASKLFNTYSRINVILKDLCVDIWLYISMNYLTQKIVKTETGSSTMPHKVNPINFENAEGNLGMANALFGFFSEKLPQSRLQRDLTDSTVIRNVGMAFGYTLVAIKSIQVGLGKISPNYNIINQELEKNCCVITEGYQTVMRKHGVSDAYEIMKSLTRKNEVITRECLFEFVNELDVSQIVKDELLAITPENYVGTAFCEN